MKTTDVARLVIFGFPGTKLTSDTQAFIQKYRPGGFIFFEDNFVSAIQASQLVHSVLDFVLETHQYTPWLCIDHENKMVNRLPSPITPFPDAPTLGTVLNKTTATLMGRTMGIELKELGFNVNFAPVCDLSTSQTPNYLQRRCFSSNPEVVASIAENFICGMQEQGVWACAKHFPGLGSADKDPHQVLVKTNQSLRDFQDKDWFPFRRAIAAGVKFIMTSHVLCENLDSHHMATYSPHIVKEVLIQKLGFKGLVVCDDIKMGAVTEDPARCATGALQAGHHLLIYSERGCAINAQFLNKLQEYALSKGYLERQIQSCIQKF